MSAHQVRASSRIAYIPWSEADDAVLEPYVRDGIGLTNAATRELADRFERTMDAVRIRLSTLRKRVGAKMASGWDAADIATLMAYVSAGQPIPDDVKYEIGERTGREIKTVIAKIRYLREEANIPLSTTFVRPHQPDAVHKPCRLCAKTFKAKTRFVLWCGDCREVHLMRDQRMDA